MRRLFYYYQKNGLVSTCERCCVALIHIFYFGRMVLFYCKLPFTQPTKVGSISVERFTENSLSKNDYTILIENCSSATRAQEIVGRFAIGSELWLAKFEGRLAGFGWSIAGRTVEPHFFQLEPFDVHLFDFFVFSEYRGRGINVLLVTEILKKLSLERPELSTAHIECAAWNHAQLRSLGKTRFHKYAEVIMFRFRNYSKVFWLRGAALR